MSLDWWSAMALLGNTTGVQHLGAPAACRENVQRSVRGNTSHTFAPAASWHADVATLDNFRCERVPCDEDVCAVGNQP